MKKTVRNTLLLLLTAGVLVGLIALLLNTESETEDEEASVSSEVEEAEILLEKEDADIDTIVFTSEEGSYVMKAYTEDGETSEDEDDTETQETTYFTVEGLEDYGVDTDAVTTAARTLYHLEVSRDLGSPDDLEDFGLAGDGEGKVELTYKEGDPDTFVIGTESGSGSGQYILFNGTVYIVPKVSDALFTDEYGFIETLLYTVTDMEETDEDGNTATVTDTITEIKLSGTQFPESIEIAYRPDELVTYVLTAPMESDASADKVSALTKTLKSLSASTAVLPGYTDDDLEEYGLSEPYAAIEFIMNDETHWISVSEKDTEGNCYLIADEIDVIYQIAWSAVSEWAELTLTDLRSSYIHLPNIQEVTEVALVQNDTETVFEITRTVDDESSTEDSTQYILTIDCDGTEVDYDTVYQPFYQELISMSLLSAESTDYDSDALVLEVSYTYFEGGSDTMTFFEVPGQERYAVELNGVFNGILRKTTVDEIIDLIGPTAANEAMEE